ncbi:MAG: hypothetical protein K9K64_16020 [Desulfohalobiaceae bacterium]|nr:hypothetical protein [Desulfohalobiaceae bacterium]
MSFSGPDWSIAGVGERLIQVGTDEIEKSFEESVLEAFGGLPEPFRILDQEREDMLGVDFQDLPITKCFLELARKQPIIVDCFFPRVDFLKIHKDVDSLRSFHNDLLGFAEIDAGTTAMICVEHNPMQSAKFKISGTPIEGGTLCREPSRRP